MPYYNVADRATMDLFPGIVTRTFWGENMLLSWAELEPNAVAAGHQHPHEQAIVVISGELTVVTDEEARLLCPGELYIVPGNTFHEARAGAEGSVVLDIFSPVREGLKY
jgi:quercetin dioxygenase-like cupin family protein